MQPDTSTAQPEQSLFARPSERDRSQAREALEALFATSEYFLREPPRDSSLAPEACGTYEVGF